MNTPQTSAEIRQAFLDYFSEVGHEVVSSAPLPQTDNPTLLFTNAGMNQFAETFLGKEKRAYNRAATSQKVMRVSGKHNDLENVGPSPRHHTFFEMLGNFSFGDYFKKQAIEFAWNFLTDVVKLDPNRLWITIYLDDDEANELWQAHVPAERILRFGKEDNFWEMGDVGPCGPCSEIFYFLPGDLAKMDPSRLNADDDEDFLEVWNLVFMQFEKSKDGEQTPLPRPSIDTGMGLERIARVVQNAESNYETDLFSGAFAKVQELLGDNDDERLAKTVGYRVIADHGRSATFLVGDGLLPGNNGAPYVLRMIIRRAARFGRKIGFTEPFLAQIADVYINEMGDAYPDLRTNRELILKTITLEEERFARTLDNALTNLESLIAETKRDDVTEIAGGVAFDLHATYGLPIEITRDIAGESGLTVDEAGFEAAKRAHAEASGAGAFGSYEANTGVYGEVAQALLASGRLPAGGVDYDPYGGFGMLANIVAIIKDGASVDEIKAGDSAEIITAATPFYIESGGEVSDSGTISADSGTFEVTGMGRPASGLIAHSGTVRDGKLSVNQSAELLVDNSRRTAIRRNHTATHILHHELRNALGKHVTQQGSLVAPDRLRFDFSHPEQVGRETLAAIETAVNTAIIAGYCVSAEHMGKADAISRGAMALFGEKYGDVVRTVQIDDGGAYSFELCGGLHVGNTGQIGSFYFTYEGSAAAGIRRVEAVTGSGAHAFATEKRALLNTVGSKLNVPDDEIARKIDALLEENRELQRQLQTVKRGDMRSQFDQLVENVQQVSGVNVLTGNIDGASVDNLREMTDWYRDKLGSGVAVLATVNDNRPIFIASVTDDLIKQGIKAGDLVREVAKVVGGGGGGRPNLAQAGGKDASKVDEALALVSTLVANAQT